MASSKTPSSTSWLGRESRARNFTKIIQSDTRPRVISIEGGFGLGKTTFAKQWAQMLRYEGEKVIEFDAWSTDHTDDPLAAFVGKLLEEMPKKPTNKWSSRRKEAVKGVANLTKLSAITVAKLTFLHDLMA